MGTYSRVRIAILVLTTAMLVDVAVTVGFTVTFPVVREAGSLTVGHTHEVVLIRALVRHCNV